MDNTREEKLSLLQDLMALSKIDGKISPDEEHFIQTIANTIGVSTNELNYLKNNSAKYNPEEKEVDRIVQFYRLLLLMGVDLEKKEKEIQFCKETGLKMGLNPHGINTTIEKIKSSETGMLPPTEIIKIFQTFHN